MADASTDLVKAVRDIIREAWQTQARIPDVDARFVGFSKAGIWNQSIREAAISYGYSQASSKRAASSHEIGIMWEVMTWMVFVRKVYGDQTLATLQALAMGVPAQSIADRKGVNRSTIWRQEQDCIRAIIREFRCPVEDVSAEEQAKAEEYDAEATIRYSRASDSPRSGSNVSYAKVWIHGTGWWKQGKAWNDGQAKARKLERVS